MNLTQRQALLLHLLAVENFLKSEFSISAERRIDLIQQNEEMRKMLANISSRPASVDRISKSCVVGNLENEKA